MRIFFYQILLIAVVWMFFATGLVLCQKLDELELKRQQLRMDFGKIISVEGKIDEHEKELKMKELQQNLQELQQKLSESQEVRPPRIPVDNKPQMYLFPGFVSQEYQLALHNLNEASEASRLGQIDRYEHAQIYIDNIKVMEAELMKAYWASVEAYGVPDAEPVEDMDPENYIELDDGFRYYKYIMRHGGDYTKLKLIIRSEKPDYNPGELVYIKFYVRNDSDSEVHILCAGGRDELIWKLFHSNYEEAARTLKWEEQYQRIKRNADYTDYAAIYGRGWRGGLANSKFDCCKLQPGQEHVLDWVSLNDYYDLSKPDTYELTCFRRAIIGGQFYEPPLQSNTLTFRILEEEVQKPEITKGEDKLTYTNPPPGEEVFKQPKPPKSLFTIVVPSDFTIRLSSTYTLAIDVPAKTMKRQWEWEREAQAAKLTDAAKLPAE